MKRVFTIINFFLIFIFIQAAFSQTGWLRQSSIFYKYPNPFNSLAKIKFDIPNFSSIKEDKGKDVRLAIYDLLGCEVATLVNEKLLPGSYEVEWDGNNFSSGVYFYKLETTSYIQIKKMVLTK